MTAWTNTQAQAIARRVVAEQQTGRPVAPERLQWALALLAGAAS